MARTCRVGESMEDFKRHLANTQEPWLLILDNADDPSFRISQFFPVGNRGTIIITTRNPNCTWHATVGSRELNEMEFDEAITLLLRSSGRPVEDKSLRDLAQPVIQTLGCLALAVIQAGASIRQGICSLGDYLEHYRRHRKKLLSTKPPQTGEDYEYTVYTTWEISLNCLRVLAKNPSGGTATNALDLLTICGFFHFDGIGEEMFKSAWENYSRTGRFAWWKSNQLRIIGEHQPSDWDPIPFREALQLLSSYSLIHHSGLEDRISLHPLVHSWIRDSLNKEVHLRWWNIALSTLALALPSDNYLLSISLAIHARHCFSLRCPNDFLAMAHSPSDTATVLFCIINIYRHSFQFNDARVLSELSLEYNTMIFGDECYSTLVMSDQLADIYNCMYEPQKAVDLLQNKVDVCIRVAGRVHSLTLRMVCKLCWAYRSLGRDQEALELAQKNVTICEELLDDTDISYLKALECLACVYLRMYQIEEAVELLEKCVSARKEIGEKDITWIIRSEGNLAVAYRKLGQHHAALKTIQKVLERCYTVYGEEHYRTLDAKSDLALILGDMGRSEKALGLISEVVNIGRRTRVLKKNLGFWEKILEYLQSQVSIPIPDIQNETQDHTT